MLQYASLLGFLRTILILILVYYAFKIVARLLAPVLMRFVARKAEKRFGEQFNQYSNPKEPIQKEGEVSIDETPQPRKASNKDVGEYVDYEEID